MGLESGGPAELGEGAEGLRPQAGDQDGFVLQLLRLQAGAMAQGVSLGGHQAEWVLAEDAFFKRVDGGTLVHHQTQSQAALCQAPQDFVVGEELNFQLKIRINRFEQFQLIGQPGQIIGQKGLADPEADRPGGAKGGGQLLLQLLKALYHRGRMLAEPLPPFGEGDMVALVEEKGLPQFLFQGGDVLAQGLAGEIQPLGGPAVIQFFTEG